MTDGNEKSAPVKRGPAVLKVYHQLTMRIPFDDWDEIEGFANEHELSYAEAMRTLLTWGLDCAQANRTGKCANKLAPIRKFSQPRRLSSVVRKNGWA